ncbi:TVP38/TMEM64 family protein [Salinispira pacifica]
MDRRKLGKFISSAAFPAIIIAIVLLALLFRREIGAVFSSRERLQSWIDQFGALGPLMFIGVQVFQVVVFIVPGEVTQLAGGYLFGVWGGILYSLVGITIGSAFNFYLARLLGISFVEGLFKPSQVERFESVISSGRARVGFFLLFLIPGIPKDILCYVAGLSRIGFLSFLLISMGGRLPGVVGSAVIGSSAARSNWVVTIVVTGIAVLLFVLGLLFRNRLHALVERVMHRGEGDDGDPEQQKF